MNRYIVLLIGVLALMVIGAVHVPAGNGVFGLIVHTEGEGRGRVAIESPGLGSVVDCGTHCRTEHQSGAWVTLTARADEGHSFTGWSGDCSGSEPLISVVMDIDRQCTALFTAGPISTDDDEYVTDEIDEEGGCGISGLFTTY